MEIRLEKLAKTFVDSKSKTSTTAVNDMDLIIPAGKLIGLLGPSGCGKSTTLFLVAGLHYPTEGRIWFGEDDVTDLSPERREIGLVFQNYALYPHMTILKNILFPLQNVKGDAKLSKEDMHKRALEIATLVGIEDQLDKKPGQLSGGQQQRVAIARALVKQPRVLLLDEPLSNLDARLRLQTREEIRRIQTETGVTTIFVTHDQEEAMSISDNIVLMNYGVIQQQGAPQEVYDNPKNLFVAKFLGTPPVNVFNGTVKANKIYIGSSMIYETEKLKNYEGVVKVAIRPEGYTPNPNGKIEVPYKFIENIGKDITLVCHHPENERPSFRIMLEEGTKVSKDKMKFDIKPDKLFVFDAATEERVL